jgi:hypothetical protein
MPLLVLHIHSSVRSTRRQNTRRLDGSGADALGVVALVDAAGADAIVG